MPVDRGAGWLARTRGYLGGGGTWGKIGKARWREGRILAGSGTGHREGAGWGWGWTNLPEVSAPHGRKAALARCQDLVTQKERGRGWWCGSERSHCSQCEEEPRSGLKDVLDLQPELLRAPKIPEVRVYRGQSPAQ